MLQTENLQVIDTLEATILIDGVATFIGNTTKANVANTNTALDIWAGIGTNKIASLKTKKDTTLDMTVTEFRPDVFAMQNGVNLDKTSTGTYYFDEKVTVTSGGATITGATRILSVKDGAGNCMEIVSGTPSAGQVKVAGTALTFDTDFDDVSVYCSYEAPAAEGAENATIIFGNKFPRNAEILLKSIVFDGESQAVVADVVIDYYKCAIDGDWSLGFEMGKNIEMPLKASVLVPKLLPNGELNTEKVTGKFVLTERI